MCRLLYVDVYISVIEEVSGCEYVGGLDISQNFNLCIGVQTDVTYWWSVMNNP